MKKLGLAAILVCSIEGILLYNPPSSTLPDSSKQILPPEPVVSQDSNSPSPKIANTQANIPVK